MRQLSCSLSLPTARLESYKRAQVRVRAGSTIQVDRNTYSVDSRLIGERVDVRLYAEELEVWFAGKVVERIPHLRGQGKHRINYRHVIDWLVRKPGAVRELPLPRGPVSHQPISDGLRRIARNRAEPCLA